MFEGFLTVRAACPACGFDLSAADSGDGPAVFVVLVAGALACFGALFMDVAMRPPIWLELAIWMPVALALCLGLLRPFKGVLVALQFHSKASQSVHGGGRGRV